MKAAEYARYSTYKQQKNSIEYQLTGIIFRGTPSKRTSPDQGVYSPEHSFATVDLPLPDAPTNAMERPGFKSMVAAASVGAFDAVVIYDITRGSRDVGDWFTFRKQMLQVILFALIFLPSLGFSFSVIIFII